MIRILFYQKNKKRKREIEKQSNKREPYNQHLFALAADNIEKIIIRNIRSRSVSGCQDCALVFNENIKVHDDLIAKKMIHNDHIFQPCVSTLNKIKFAESISNQVFSSRFCSVFKINFAQIGNQNHIFFSVLEYI